MNNKLMRLLIVFSLATTLFACENDPKLPDNLIEFEAEVAGISAEENSLEVHLNLSRPASADVVVTISLEATGLQYGTDFTTTPEASANIITTTIPAGETQTAIVLTKGSGVGFTGDETIVFSINEVEGTPVIGTIPQITVSFSEITLDRKSTRLNSSHSQI